MGIPPFLGQCWCNGQSCCTWPNVVAISSRFSTSVQILLGRPPPEPSVKRQISALRVGDEALSHMDVKNDEYLQELGDSIVSFM